MFKKIKISLIALSIVVVMLPAVSLAAFGISISDEGWSVGFSDGSSSTTSSSSYGAAASSRGGWSMGNIAGFGLPRGSITGIIVNILSWLLMIFGFLGIIGFIISGLMYILAAGDETTIDKAKKAMKYSIIGVLVGIAGFVVIQAITSILSVGYVI